ncbi:FecR family protein [Chitinophaga barathri]|uniref:FecR family protein n=1 Tax=Chitinophaga barathri TaxID=1647451 RepID=A0A3N4M5Y3_9BACT|nr:FecR family protein [Chitinophaga barathri]RPD38518.1 FecR family protein [Chitinophaga barathri]
MHYSHQTAEELLLIESFIHYCKGAPEADVQYWQALLRNYPDQQPEAARAREIFHVMQGYPPVSLKAAALERLKESLDAQETDTSETVTRVRRLPYRWMAAAGVAVIAASAFLLMQNPEKHIIHYNTLAQTGMQDRKTLSLPDGSEVLLSTASTLQLSDAFGKKDRNVYLEGEAFFTVKSNTNLPFTVVTRKAATTVLGTTFKVRCYGDDAQVMLASGKVRVEADAAAMELQPGEEAVVENGAPLKKMVYQKEEMQRWINRKVEFANADMDQITAILKEYYGVNVRMEKRPAGKVMFTGIFHDQQLNVVLDAISFTNNFTYRLEHNEVVIRF